jgi:hypothetical protein
MTRRYPADRAPMLVAEVDGLKVVGALGFRHDDPPGCPVTLRILAVDGGGT